MFEFTKQKQNNTSMKNKIIIGFLFLIGILANVSFAGNGTCHAMVPKIEKSCTIDLATCSVDYVIDYSVVKYAPIAIVNTNVFVRNIETKSLTGNYFTRYRYLWCNAYLFPITHSGTVQALLGQTSTRLN